MSANHIVSDFRTRLLLTKGDAERLALHMEYLPATAERAAAEAVVMANEAHRLMARLGRWDLEPLVLRHRAAAHLNLANPVQADADLREAHDRYTDATNRGGMATISVLLADVQLRLGRPAACCELLARASAEAPDDAPGIRADVLEAVGRFKLATSDYAGAVESLRGALALYEGLDDRAGTGRALSGIGTAFAGLNDLDAACDHHNESLEAFRAAGDLPNQIRTLGNLASIGLARGLLQEALDQAARAHALCLLNDDVCGAASMRMMMGDIHARLDERDVALEHYLDAHKLLERHPTDELLLALYHRIGAFHQTAGAPDAARHVFVQALAIAERLGDRRMVAGFHEALAAVLESLGEYRDALLQHRKFAALREEIAGEDRVRTISDLQAQYEREMMEQERARAESRAAEMRAEIEAQREEITETLRNLAQSNAALEKLKEDLRQLHGAVGKKGNKAMDDIMERISRDISVTRKADHEWKQIQRNMDRLHPGFAARLFEVCPKLTRTELKICMLTRLGHGTASIAETLDNEQRTVQTQRLRIRRKFALAGDVDFTAFIANL